MNVMQEEMKAKMDSIGEEMRTNQERMEAKIDTN
jgi:hypothetical protein